MKKRDAVFDSTKGIGILCVVLGHMGLSFQYSPLVNAVYPFHMPLFFLSAGWFLNEKLFPKDYFIKRFYTLITAYVFTSCCLILCSIMQDVIAQKSIGTVAIDALLVFVRALYGSGSTANRTPWGIGQIGAIWFLPAMLWASSLTRWVISRAIHLGNQIAIIVLIFLASWLSARWIWLPFSIQAGGCAAFYVYAGFLLRSTVQRRRDALCVAYKSYSYVVLLLAALAWMYANLLKIYPDLVCASFPHCPACIIVTLLSSLGIFIISKWICAFPSVERFFCFYGRRTLFLLCLHLIELDYLPWELLYDNIIRTGIQKRLCLFAIYILKILLLTFVSIFASKNHFIQRIFHLPK